MSLSRACGSSRQARGRRRRLRLAMTLQASTAPANAMAARNVKFEAVGHERDPGQYPARQQAVRLLARDRGGRGCSSPSFAAGSRSSSTTAEGGARRRRIDCPKATLLCAQPACAPHTRRTIPSRSNTGWRRNGMHGRAPSSSSRFGNVPRTSSSRRSLRNRHSPLRSGNRSLCGSLGSLGSLRTAAQPFPRCRACRRIPCRRRRRSPS
jgi:hypothetical protein